MTGASPVSNLQKSPFSLAELKDSLQSFGMIPLCIFRPGPNDGVPNIEPGLPAKTLILTGNAGPEMWRAFTSSCDPERDLLDNWSAMVLGGLATQYGAVAHYPWKRPYLPFQQWARHSGQVYNSPLGINIHVKYGLWHGYRGALAFAEVLEMPVRESGTYPCESCSDPTCLNTCPVGAFNREGYDVPACVANLLTPSGQDCLMQACRSRRACPVGRDYQYEPAQARFHIGNFLLKHRTVAARSNHVK